MSDMSDHEEDFHREVRYNPSTGSMERPGRARAYLSAHWHGRQSLARAFWINTVAASAALALLEGGTLALLLWRPPAWALVITILAVYTAVRLMVAGWQIVGTLRTASLVADRWSSRVNVVMSVAILAILGQMAAFGWEIQALTGAATSQLVMSQGNVSVSPQGDAIVGKGAMSLDFVSAVRRAFAQHPEVSRLLLDVSGSDATAAVRLRDFLAQRPDIVVEVDTRCANACLVAFVAANHRVIGPKGVLSFSPLPAGDDLGLLRHLMLDAQNGLRHRLITLGASTFFLSDALGTPRSGPYAPDATTLFGNGVITGIHLESGVMDGDAWRVEQFIYPLRQNPKFHNVVRALEIIRTRYPAIFDKWLKSNLAARYQSTETARAASYERATLQAIDTASLESIKSVPDASIQRLAMDRREELTQIAELTSTERCGEYMRGFGVDLGTRQFEFFLRSIDRMEFLIADSLPDPAPTYEPIKGKEVLEAARQPIETALPRHVGQSPYETACPRELALLDHFIATPSAEHTMALRFMFQGDDDRGHSAFLFNP